MKRVDDFRLRFGKKEYVPIMIGGMGVDISTSELALEAARLNGIGHISDAMVEDVNYTMVTDLQISERSKAKVTTDNIAALRQGTSGVKLQTSSEQGDRAKYQTRVVSNANKVNLKFEEAKPVLEAQLAKSVANIL